MTRMPFLCLLALFLVAPLSRADITSVTLTGSLTADNSLVTYNFTDTSTQTLDFFTTSYAGGVNADGTTTPAGGFVPVLTLFSNSTGNVVGFGGAAGVCNGPVSADPSTHLCDDANFIRTLAPGAYTLILSEFPNVPTGNLSSPGFLFASDPTATGDVCGVPGGKFLESDLASCVQRTSNYAVNIRATPEPSSIVLLLLPAAGMFRVVRRQFA